AAASGEISREEAQQELLGDRILAMVNRARA
ncbi:TetR/AcrR family transcriptional regulator, partial [Pseudomonas fluorescens]